MEEKTIKDYLLQNRISEATIKRCIAEDSQPTPEELKPELLKINEERIYTSKRPVFITERVIDALSIIDIGGEAVAIGKAPYGFLNYIMAHSKRWQASQAKEEDRTIKHLLIIAFNAGEESQKNKEALIDGLNQLEVPFQISDIITDHEDISSAFFVDREGFIKTVKKAEAQEYLNNSAAANLQDFRKKIKKNADKPPISTGFKDLDGLLDGGLYAGLYFIGAVSSLGKTTFTLQMADNLARQGQDVLIFSLEMARDELIAKSISRLTYMQATDKRNAKTTRGILSGARYANYSQAEKDLIDNAIKTYEKYAKHIFISEGIGDIGTEQIKEKIKQHIFCTGKAPVIIIDYVQILTAYDTHLSDKQATDRNTTELKRLSRDFNIPVICISSFNRDNYNEPVNLTSFKESGSIEYSSDTLIGLQYAGMDYCEEDKDDKTRKKRIRKLLNEVARQGKEGEGIQVQLKVLKNRNGSRGQALFNFYAMFNYFCENEGFIPAPEGTEDIFKTIRKN